MHRIRDYLILALVHLYSVFLEQFGKQQGFLTALSIIFC